MKRKLLLCFVLLAIPFLRMYADKGVLITHRDNSVTFLSLENEIKASFVNGNTLKFSGLGISDLELDVSDVMNFKIAEYNNTSINKTTSQNIQIRMSESEITLSGLSDKQSVSLLDIKGVVRCLSIANNHGKTHINMEGLPQGVYVLSLSNGKTYKILKK